MYMPALVWAVGYQNHAVLNLHGLEWSVLPLTGYCHRVRQAALSLRGEFVLALKKDSSTIHIIGVHLTWETH